MGLVELAEWIRRKNQMSWSWNRIRRRLRRSEADCEEEGEEVDPV